MEYFVFKILVNYYFEYCHIQTWVPVVYSFVLHRYTDIAILFIYIVIKLERGQRETESPYNF